MSVARKRFHTDLSGPPVHSRSKREGTHARRRKRQPGAVVRFEALCPLRPGRLLSALRFSLRDTYDFDALPNETSHPGCYGSGYISAEREAVTSAAFPHLIRANGGVSRVNYKRLVTAAAELFDRLSTAWWIPALLMRLFVGYFFMETGWGKIHNLEAFTTRFAGWGIPYPAFNAALSAYTEFLGGALTILGLGMRFVSIPMIINMIVAVLTVKLKSVGGLDDFAELDEPLYALSFVWLFFSGAGWLSVDFFLRQLVDKAIGRNSSSIPSSAGFVRLADPATPHLHDH